MDDEEIEIDDEEIEFEDEDEEEEMEDEDESGDEQLESGADETGQEQEEEVEVDPKKKAEDICANRILTQVWGIAIVILKILVISGGLQTNQTVPVEEAVDWREATEKATRKEEEE